MAAPSSSEPRQPGHSEDLFRSRYPEATLSAILLGLVFGVRMNMAITCAGLKMGFTIVGSAIAAVVGCGVRRGSPGWGWLVLPRSWITSPPGSVR